MGGAPVRPAYGLADSVRKSRVPNPCNVATLAEIEVWSDAVGHNDLRN
jgi:hypothetical protein